MAYGPPKWNPVPSPMGGPQTGPVGRRHFLLQGGAGLGGLALSYLLQRETLLASESPGGPLAPKPPHLAAKAKSCIFLFMGGGPGHMDTFDPKPELTRPPRNGCQRRTGPTRRRQAPLYRQSLPVQQTGEERHRGLRAFPSSGRVGRRNVGGSVSLHRQRQPYRRLPAHEPGPPHAGQSLPGFLDGLRPGHREPGFACLCGPARLPIYPRPPELVQRISAGHLSRHPAEPGGAAHRRSEAARRGDPIPAGGQPAPDQQVESRPSAFQSGQG